MNEEYWMHMSLIPIEIEIALCVSKPASEVIFDKSERRFILKICLKCVSFCTYYVFTRYTDIRSVHWFFATAMKQMQHFVSQMSLIQPNFVQMDTNGTKFATLTFLRAFYVFCKRQSFCEILMQTSDCTFIEISHNSHGWVPLRIIQHATEISYEKFENIIRFVSQFKEP